MTEKCYSEGDAFPELKPGTLRVYSMRFCPFAERTRLLLAHKKIPFETININLKSKPDWFLKRNPLGKVPVIEHQDKVVYDSAICNDYLDEVYPESPLNPKDPFVRAQHRILLEHYGSWIGAYYKFLFSGSKDEEALAIIHKVSEQLDQFLTQPVSAGSQQPRPFFGGSEVGLIDLHIWPWMERVDGAIFQGKVLPEGKYPQIRRWMHNMSQTEAVKAIALDAKVHSGFYEGYAAGKGDYDYGLEE